MDIQTAFGQALKNQLSEFKMRKKFPFRFSFRKDHIDQMQVTDIRNIHSDFLSGKAALTKNGLFHPSFKMVKLPGSVPVALEKFKEKKERS